MKILFDIVHGKHAKPRCTTTCSRNVQTVLLPPPPQNSRKFNNETLEDSVIEKAWEDFLENDASQAKKIEIDLALRYIHENLLSPSLSVKEVIEECRISSHSFSYRFAGDVALNGNARKTPGEYITWARMQVARRILEHGPCSMTQLAYALGFNSYLTFWRACHKHLGCKPSEAAKMNREAD